MSDLQKPTPEQAAWVFRHLRDHFKEGGTFRYLIYERMGYGPEDYQLLYRSGGFILSQIANEYLDYQRQGGENS